MVPRLALTQLVVARRSSSGTEKSTSRPTGATLSHHPPSGPGPRCSPLKSTGRVPTGARRRPTAGWPRPLDTWASRAAAKPADALRVVALSPSLGTAPRTTAGRAPRRRRAPVGLCAHQGCSTGFPVSFNGQEGVLTASLQRCSLPPGR